MNEIVDLEYKKGDGGWFKEKLINMFLKKQTTQRLLADSHSCTPEVSARIATNCLLGKGLTSDSILVSRLYDVVYTIN